MIVKLGQELEWEYFVRKDKLVKALKMREDFLVETYLDKGFLEGKRGDFIVEVAPGIRFPCTETHFLNGYHPVPKAGEHERRSGIERRAHTFGEVGKSGPGPDGEGGL